MDPLSQGVLGASLPQATSQRQTVGCAGLFGFLAGMAPDLDVLIRSPDDPLLFLEYHRQFTHSLVFIPVGGLICGLLLYALWGRGRGLSWHRSWLFCTLGYGTHALLDTCTTYGTQLLWPFSSARIAWNNISIIDPLFTLPLLTLVLLAAYRKQPKFARAGLAWALIYLSLGVVQRERAEAAGWELARQRQHQPLRLEAKPSFANIILWKIVYQTEEHYYVDAVRVLGGSKVYPGESVATLDVARDLPWLDPGSQQARDIERFRWFSNGYIAQDPAHQHRIIDVRYSMIPNQVDALWGIELSPKAGLKQHVDYKTTRGRPNERLGLFRSMLFD
jgi:inner membrane protein